MSGPLTDRRERNQADYAAYYARYPEQTLKDQARQAEYQAESRGTAHRHKESWAEWEEALVLDFDTPIREAAQITGRTYAAVRQARHRYVKAEKLVNELIKDESEEYDGSKRHTPAFAKGGSE